VSLAVAILVGARAYTHDCVGCPVSMPFRLTQDGAILFVTLAVRKLE